MITITAVPFLLPQLTPPDVSPTTIIATAKVPLLASLPALSPHDPFVSLPCLPSQPCVSYMDIITTARELQRLSCPLLCFVSADAAEKHPQLCQFRQTFFRRILGRPCWQWWSSHGCWISMGIYVRPQYRYGSSLIGFRIVYSSIMHVDNYRSYLLFYA